MNIGIPKEARAHEGRVSLTPAACRRLLEAGHQIYVQSTAGVNSGYADQVYSELGVRIVDDAADLYANTELIVKVKEPVASDLQYLRSDHRLFCYLHLAADPQLTRRLCDIGLTAVAFETVQEPSGALPLLAPMSAIAGRLSVQVGTHLLHQSQGGKGVLLGGVAGARRGRVVVLGIGVAGFSAAQTAAGLGAEVIAFDRQQHRLEAARSLGANVTALYAHSHDIDAAVRTADLVIGAVLVTGEKAPKIVSEAVVGAMEAGSVIVDISVDQGGCIATTRATDYSSPTYVYKGVTHFCVTNMPGAVPHTASPALSGALVPYVERLAGACWRDDTELQRGMNIDKGRITYPALAA